MALAIKNIHDNLGDDIFNLAVATIMIVAKNKEKMGEKMDFKDIERVFRKVIEMVKEI